MTQATTPSKTAPAVYQFFLFLVGLLGILMQLGVFSGEIHFQFFRMFTILSNCVCVLYLLASFLWTTAAKKPGDFCPALNGVCLLSISVTGIVAAVMLPGMINFSSQQGVSMFLLHVVMPIGFLLHWLLFSQKGVWRPYAPLTWLIAPYLYFAYIMISAQFVTGSTRFPYPFLDYETLGVGKMALILLGMTGFFLLLGYAYFRIDRALAQKARRR